MIEYTSGNIFEADVEALVNPVNTVGVMGKGLAMQFRRAYPEIIEPYQAACKTGQFQIGSVLTVPIGAPTKPHYVINFPTKKQWRDDSKMEYVTKGLAALSREIRSRGISSVAIPPLGCGLGGLRWSDVRPIVETHLQVLRDVCILVFEPPDHS